MTSAQAGPSGGAKVASYHAPPEVSPLSGATIHELRCLKTRIQLGYHLVPHMAQTLLAELPSSTYVLITDANLARLGAIDKFQRALLDAGMDTGATRFLSYAVPAGEQSKSREGKAAIEDWMLSERVTRDTVVIAVGGGVVGDLVGFVAATFMRGLRLVQVPTTLLAMVDSAIGGKTAIDHPQGKNLLGAFHQPEFVFVDAAWLGTLPPRELSNGMAEVVKTAAIWDAADFAKLESEAEAIWAAGRGEETVRSGAEDAGRTLETRSTAQTLLLDVIRGSIGVKAQIVNLDERETGLRNLVNFGHSIGHAIEAVLTPGVLHGECVAIGMVLEAELARQMHALPQVAISRLVCCLRNYALPVSLSDARITAQPAAAQLTTARLLDIMRVDKKNAGTQKRVVLLRRIGATVEERASTVPDALIERVLAPAVLVRPALPVPVRERTSITPPGSKSVSNRALLLAALSSGSCRLRNLLHSDDTQVMLAALRELRVAEFAYEDGGETLVVHGHGGRVLHPKGSAPVYLQNAGTAARFVTSVCALLRQPETPEAAPIHLTGNQRMQQRPIGPLVDALRANGTHVEYTRNAGCLPLAIYGSNEGLRGGRMELAASVSSQYVSSILLCAPYAAQEVTLELVGGHVVSQPYIDMTVAMMRAFGVHVERLRAADGSLRDAYRIPRGAYRAPAHYEVESDASSATYPLALAAITGTQCTVHAIGSESLQGDARFAREVLAPMGCVVEQSAASTTVAGPPPGALRQLGTIDMESMTDAFLTAAVLLAVATHGEHRSTRITGIANQRVKECNRIAAVIAELARFGVRAVEHDDGLEVFPVAPAQLRAGAGGEPVHCYDDHRVAMAFSVLAAATPPPGTLLLEKRCVEKTWPAWWDDLETRLGVSLAGAHLDAPLVPQPSPAATPSTECGAGHAPLVPGAPALTPARYAADASIVCIGMRASGKTLLGQRLAARLSRRFLDADAVLEQRFPIGEFVREHGWARFREEETRLLRQLLAEARTGYVVARGGGVIETEACRELLTDYARRLGPVVHIVRDEAAIAAFLETSDRPAYGEPLAEVLARRAPHYHACSSCEALSGATAEVDADVRALARALRTPLGAAPAVPMPRSYFLSLTFPEVREALGALREASIGADVLELRVDLLCGTLPTGAVLPPAALARVREQVAVLRAHSELPLLFTVRSASQGGRFPDEAHDAYFALVELALRVGCEYVDVELQRPAARLAAVAAARGHTRLLVSVHDTTGSLRWEAPETRALYERGAALGDVVKIVGVARTMQDNLALEAFRASVAGGAPLIALNMGAAGQLSRVLNDTLTPVTHPALPARAAPGQLSVREIHTARHLLGLLPARRFVLLGSPIAHSLSPLLHNTGFELLGLPHVYERHECEELGDAEVDLLRSPEFGGASVTIPHKLRIMQLLDDVAPDAQVIGAVNTVVPSRAEAAESVRLTGHNTDWLAIHALAAEALGGVPPTTSLVIGAGGSARAAIYAMHRLGAQRILLFNRTHERAEALAADVPAEWHVQPVRTLEEAAALAPAAIVSNVPAAGTAIAPGTPEAGVVLPADLLRHVPGGGVAIDMAYKPEHTPLLELVHRATQQDTAHGAPARWKGVPGLAILLAQGFAQFRLWTGLAPPSEAIADRAWAAYRAQA